MRKLAVLALAFVMAAGEGPVVGQTPTLERALSRARAATPLSAVVGEGPGGLAG